MTEEDFETRMNTTGDYGSQTDAKIALDAVVNSLIQSLVKGEGVALEGLGTFTIEVSSDMAMKGPTIVPGYSKKEFSKSPYSVKTVKIRFDKVLKHKINE